MSDLVKFLEDRLGEDEQAAHAASTSSAAPWRLTTGQDDFDGDVLIGYTVLRDAEGLPITDDRGGFTEEDLGHFARFDPTRVLREVEAKRRLIEESVAANAATKEKPDASKTWTARNRAMGEAITRNNTMHLALRIAALPYADHPDYREEWRP